MSLQLRAITTLSYSVQVRFLRQDHVFRYGVSLLQGNLQSLPQLLDLTAVGRAAQLILSLALLQLEMNTSTLDVARKCLVFLLRMQQ